MSNLPPSDQASSTDQTRWFTDEIQPHEPMLRSYLHASFPTVRDIDDVVQESYLRICKARAAYPIRSAKAFLFTVARRLALNSVQAKQTQSLEALGDLAGLSVLEETPNAAEALIYKERISLLGKALARLPVRCREIVVLRRLHRLSQKEVAARLGLSERTVENQLARGTKRCETFLRRHGVDLEFER